MPLTRYDGLFGGKPGAAEKALRQMRSTYGTKDGEAIFYATIKKRQLRAKRQTHRVPSSGPSRGKKRR